MKALRVAILASLLISILVPASIAIADCDARYQSGCCKCVTSTPYDRCQTSLNGIIACVQMADGCAPVDDGQCYSHQYCDPYWGC